MIACTKRLRSVVRAASLTCTRGRSSWTRLRARLTDLATGGFALAEDLGDLVVAAFEDFVQEEGGAFFGRQAFEHDEKGDGKARGQLGRRRQRVALRFPPGAPGARGRRRIRVPAWPGGGGRWKDASPR